MTKANYSTKELFEECPVPKALTILSVPAIIGQLITLIYNIADTFFIGRVNNPLMISATSFAFPIFAICIPLSIVAGSGGGSLVSRLLGIYHEDEAKRVATFSAYLAITLALLFSAVVFIFMDPLLRFMGTSSDTYEYTRQYLMTTVVIGAVPIILSNALANLLRSTGQSKVAGFGVSMGGVINIVLDPIFMFVILPKGQEVLGAGIATMLSSVCSCIFFIVKIKALSGNTPIGFDLSVGLPEKEHIKEVFTVGLPASIATLLFDANNMILNKLMSAYGDIAVAAIGMTIKIERFSLNTCVGICMGMAPIAGYNYSSGDHERMKACISLSKKRGLTVALITLVLYEIFATQFTRFFIADPQTVALGAAFLRRRAVAAPLMFMTFYMSHVLQAVGDGKWNFVVSSFRYLCLCIPALFVCDALIGMYGLAWAQTVGDGIGATLTAIFYSWYSKKNFTGEKNIKRQDVS